MSSSREEAIFRLRNWTTTKAPISAAFTGKGLSFCVRGSILFDEDKEVVLLVRWRGNKPKILLTLSLIEAVPCESFDTLRDAANDWNKLPFVVAESFRLLYGYVDFREMASTNENDD